MKFFLQTDRIMDPKKMKLSISKDSLEHLIFKVVTSNQAGHEYLHFKRDQTYWTFFLSYYRFEIGVIYYNLYSILHFFDILKKYYKKLVTSFFLSLFYIHSYKCIFLSIYLSISLSNFLSIYLYFYRSIYISVYLSIFLPISLSSYLSSLFSVRKYFIFQFIWYEIRTQSYCNIGNHSFIVLYPLYSVFFLLAQKCLFIRPT